MSYVFGNVVVNNSISGGGVNNRAPVLAATTVAQTLATDFENGDIIDGVTLSTGDRVLIKNQAAGVENGIYIVQASGAPIRASDFAAGESASGVTVTVLEGSENDDTVWMCTDDAPNDIVGTDALSYIRSAGLGANGNVMGPVSSTVNAVPRFTNTTGSIFSNSGVLVDGSNNMSGLTSVAITGGSNSVTISAASQTVGSSTITIPDLAGISGGAVVTNAMQTLTNKTLTTPTIAQIISGGSTLTLPSGVTDTLVARTTTDTLTNKTLTTPIIAQITNGGGTLTLPSGVTDTIVARATSDTLTNKTMNASNNTFSNFLHGTQVDNPSSGVHGVTGTVVGTSDVQTLTNKTLTSPTISGGTINNASVGATTATTGRFTTVTATNTTNQFAIGTTNITTLSYPAPAGAVTLTFPNTADTIVGRATTDTLTNKTLTSPTISGGTINNATVGATIATTGRFTTVTATNTTNQILLGTTNVLTINSSQTGSATLTIPDLVNTGQTLALLSTAQTFSGVKTFSVAPVISTITNTGTLTLPTSTDTLVGRATTDTLTNKTLTSPRIGTSILDTNGATLISLTATGTAVNAITLANASTGTSPTITASGTDTNIGLVFQPKGTGTLSILGTATGSGALRLHETTGNGTDYVALSAPSAIPTTFTLNLPNTEGAPNQFLKTDGGNPATLSWSTPSTGGGDVLGPGAAVTDNAVVRWNGTSGTAIQNSGVIISDTNSITGLVNVGMSGDILDANGNMLIDFITTASAVNEVSITNAATGTNPVIGAGGSDTNISLEYLSKGTGVHIFDNSTTAAEIRMRDDTGTDYVGLRAAATTTSYTLTLPAAQGGAGQIMQNNGSGALSWGAATITNSLTSATATTSTTSTTYVLLNSMTTTPGAGTYLVSFSSSGNIGTANTTGRYAIFNNGTIVQHSERNIASSASQTITMYNALHSQSIETVSDGQAIEVRYTTAAGTFTVLERSLILIKLS